MSGILDLLNSDLGKTMISGVASETGQDQNKTGDLLTMALPVLMQAMNRNANSAQGAESLQNALNNKHDGSILDDLGSFFQGGVDNEVVNDGSKILNHVLGEKQPNVEKALGLKTGLDANTVAKILKIATPLLMGYLGKQHHQSNINSGDDLTSMLGGLIQGSSKGVNHSFLESMLDADGDGSIVDDVAGMFLDSNKSQGGISDLLGKFLK
ncbi:DUF937 domain-containing protein [Formosa sp. S-31]|uniref:DUF937 domain-containing protein n=1 Tax=Formosa sp. S-31 TaxID=2790949 RepID=UPI003EBA55CD